MQYTSCMECHKILYQTDKIFTNQVWQDLFRLIEVELHLSIVYYPQTDGQTERVNRCLEIYLRCLCFQNPHKWLKWLSLAEWWYNTNHHFLGMTPYPTLYGHPPLYIRWLTWTCLFHYHMLSAVPILHLGR